MANKAVPGLLAVLTALICARGVVGQVPPKPTPIEPGNNQLCLDCHGPQGMFTEGSKYIVSGDRLKHSVHKDHACTDCHAKVVTFPHVKGGEAKAIACADCHQETMTVNRLPRHDAPGTFANSVHRPKGEPGDKDLPQCLNCHSDDPHFIQKPQTWTKRLEAEKCSKCHADKAKMDRHNIRVAAALSYFTSFHGKAVLYGSQKTATCVDCHNAHDVQAPASPRSSTNPRQLQKTCEYCHPGASYNFAMAGTGHLDLTFQESLPLRITYWFFLGILIFTFCMLGVALFLDIRSRVRARRRRMLDPSEPTPEAPLTYIRRWSVEQRLQHGLFALSITLLILTGFPLRFPDAAGFHRIYGLLGGLELARVLHRVGAIGLLSVAVWHVGMLVWRWARLRLHPRDWPMLLNRKDASDAKIQVQHWLGKRPDEPRVGRYSFREKLDYACEYWGVPVMVITGFVLWFPGYFTRYVPGVVISMSYVAHGIEATLAATVILIWHMYHALVSAGIRANRAWWDGTVSLEYLKHHHPLEYEKILRERQQRAPEAQEPTTEPGIAPSSET